MSVQNILTIVVAVTACLCLLAVFLAPFFHVTMPPELVAFITNMVILIAGAGGGAGLTVFGVKQGAQQEQMRMAALEKK